MEALWVCGTSVSEYRKSLCKKPNMLKRVGGSGEALASWTLGQIDGLPPGSATCQLGDLGLRRGCSACPTSRPLKDSLQRVVLCR